MPIVSLTGHFKAISSLRFSLLFAIGVQFYNVFAFYMSKFGAFRERAAHVVYRPCSLLLTVYFGVCICPRIGCCSALFSLSSLFSLFFIKLLRRMTDMKERKKKMMNLMD